MKNNKGDDYKNPIKVLNNFKESTVLYEEWKASGDKENLNIKRKLNLAGEMLYKSCELALKHHLSKRFNIMVDAKEITWTEKKDRESSWLFYNLKDYMEKHADPLPQRTGIDLDVIDDGLRKAAGGSKHKDNDVDEETYLNAWGEIKKIIITYIDKNAKLELLGYNNAEWTRLFSDCIYFEPGNYEYVIVVDSLAELSAEEKSRLLYINWSLVIDLDIYSDSESTAGLAYLYQQENGRQPHPVNRKHPEKTQFINGDDTPYWYYAKGFHDITETIINNTNDTSNDNADKEFRRWETLYGRRLVSLFEKFYETHPKDAKVFIFADEYRIIDKIRESLNIIYDPEMTEENIMYYCFSDMMGYKSLDASKKPSNWHQMRMDTASFVNQLSLHASNFKKTVTRRTMSIPAEHPPKTVSPASYPCYDILHSEIVAIDEHDENKKDESKFLMADIPISWYGLKHDFDVKRISLREMYIDIQKRLLRGADEKTRDRIDLIHLPGVGGTTFSRRLAFNLYEVFPVVFLRYYLPDKSAKQLSDFYKLTQMPVLVFAEAANITQDQIEDYERELRSTYIFPYVLVYVRRKRQSDADCFLGNLNDIEAHDMYVKLETYTNDPTRLEKLTQIRDSQSDKDEKTPFYMALTAFDDSFKGVGSYVERFLKDLSVEEKKYFAYIAIADEYAQQAINTEFFENHKYDELNLIFGNSDAFKHLIVIRGSKDEPKYKPRNPLFAKEIIHQIIGSKENDPDFIDSMITYCESLIRTSRNNSFIRHTYIVNLLKNLFIVKNNADIINERFAPLITKLMTNENDTRVGSVFKALVQIYPEEPHFLAHLARYYSHVEKNYERGIEIAYEAVNMTEEEDSYLYHILGICLRRKIYYLHSRLKRYGDFERNADEEKLIMHEVEDIASKASKAFAIARKNKKAAGYISDIEMCIGILDIGRKISGLSTAEFFEKYAATWFMVYVGRAVTLYDELILLEDRPFDEMDEKKGEDSSYDSSSVPDNPGISTKKQIQKQRIKNDILQITLGIESTIKMWQENLEKLPDYLKPQARMFIINGILEKNKKNYGGIEQGHLQDIMEYAEMNIAADPDLTLNYHMWFNAAIYYESEKGSEIFLDEVVKKLQLWKLKSNCAELHFFYFVALFIKAYENTTTAEASLASALMNLKTASANRPKKLSIIYRFNKGSGLGRLRKREDGESREEVLKGRISHYISSYHAYIRCYNVDIFFSPHGTSDPKIDDTHEGNLAAFSFYFSYDGPRAFNSTVKAIQIDLKEYMCELEKFTPDKLTQGVEVSCIVDHIQNNFVNVRILQYNINGSIEKRLLVSPYSVSNLPTRGVPLTAYVRKQIRNKQGELIVQLTMHKPE